MAGYSFSHKLHFSWDVKLYEELRVQEGKLADTIADYIPSWEESVPFTRRKISACNLYPPVVNIIYERLPRFNSKLHGGTLRLICLLCICLFLVNLLSTLFLFCRYSYFLLRRSGPVCCLVSDAEHWPTFHRRSSSIPGRVRPETERV